MNKSSNFWKVGLLTALFFGFIFESLLIGMVFGITFGVIFDD